MNQRFIPITSIVTCVALFTTSCENLTPGENAAVFSTVTALAVGIPLAAVGVDPRIAVPVTLGAMALAGVGAYVISKHQATQRQRRIAEQRARLYLAERAAQKRKASSSSSSSSKAKKPPKESRYIAVKTEKESFNKGSAAVMIFDTQSNQIVGNSVYDVKAQPKVGETAKFETYSAQYVGNGS